MTAARLYLSYTAGKSTQPPDPDRLTLDEWDIYRKTPVQHNDFAGAFNGVLAEAVCGVMRICLPFLIDHQTKQLAQMLGGTPPAEPANDPQKNDPPAQTPPAQTPSKDQLPEPSGTPAVAPAVEAPPVKPPSPGGSNGAAAATPQPPAGDPGAPAIGSDIAIDSLLASLLSGDYALSQANLPSGAPSPIGDNGAAARPRRKKKRRK